MNIFALVFGEKVLFLQIERGGFADTLDCTTISFMHNVRVRNSLFFESYNSELISCFQFRCAYMKIQYDIFLVCCNLCMALFRFEIQM